jgi:hypothetical protein
MRRFLVAALVSSVMSTAIVSVRAQSLADVARKEEERRKTTPSGKVYSNKDLKPSPTPPPAAAASPDAKDALNTGDKDKADQDKSGDDNADQVRSGDASASKDPKGTGKEQEAPKEPAPKASKDDQAPKAPRDRGYWAGRVKALQDQLDRDRIYADALQSRINGLAAELVNRDDPAQRSVIERDRAKSLAELDRLKQAIPADTKALADLMEEARRAGVPPAWLR